VIIRVTRDEILPLRHAVMRPNLPVETAMYPEDDTPGVFHLAEREPDGIISCATFFPDALPDQPDGDRAWRFRGMATRPERRNAGIGGKLLEYGIDEVARLGAPLVWCNGRAEADAFYRRHGFVTVGEEFLLAPHHTPHYVYVRTL
jgi:GNAT superfamily N-acetyltransferase